MDNEIWTFTSTVTTPSGIRVVTSVELPGAYPDEHVKECAELTQMAASQCANRVAKSLRENAERCPF
jgi:hypothetical protein